MKKNILIIGYGNIASRLHTILCKDIYKIYGISRSKKRGLKNFIKWNWLSKDLPNIQCNNFDSIIFVPKPTNGHQAGYHEGFLKSSENIFNFLEASEKILLSLQHCPYVNDFLKLVWKYTNLKVLKLLIYFYTFSSDFAHIF